MPIQISRPRPCRTLYGLNGVILVALLWSAGSLGADTQDPGTSMFSFHGFGTLGVVHSSDDQSDFVSNPNQAKGAGFTNRWSATPDTKLGVQLEANVTDRLSAVVQFVSQYQYDGTFRPDLEWGNIKYQVTSDLDIRVGRIAIPTYMVSDSLNVGYTLPFVRIPLEIYSQLPATHSDGIDGSYRFRIGEVTNTVQTFAGQFDSKLPNGGIYNIRDLKGIVDTIEYGATAVHLSYQTLRYDLTFTGVAISKDPQSIASIGVSYDPGPWFASGEWIRAPDDALGLYYCWYVVGGYRVDKFTPYIGFARAYLSHTGSTGLGPFIDQGTATLGARWDFMKNVDLKLQLDHIALHGGFDEFFLNQQPNFKADGSINIVSLAVDFVF